jgi:23S rRNA G2069 N7-methylase RlmK/C1962 C5-methylase RlmI
MFLKRYADRREPLAQAAEASPTHVVHESGLKFRVNLADFADTGFRPDLRTLRGMIRDSSAGKRVLSLLGNTGGFAVAAAAGGAAETVSVDPLAIHRRWAQRNLQANSFDSPQHRAVHATPVHDFDIITLEDPPGEQDLLPVALERLAPITRQTVPAEYRDRRVHRSWRIRRYPG